MSEDTPELKFNISDWPSDFVPAGGEIFIGIDQGSPDGDYSVKGFYKDGVLHVQEIITRAEDRGE